MAKRLLIALIDATPSAMEPIRVALKAGWPEAEPVNILEDGPPPDRACQPEVTQDLVERIVALARCAELGKAQAVLFTRPAFSWAIEHAASLARVPVLKPNEAMFEAAIRRGGTAMLCTVPRPRDGMEQEFRGGAERLNLEATIASILVPGIIEAIRATGIEAHNRLVPEAATGLRGFDSVVPAHVPTARARVGVEAATRVPVLASPGAAAKLQRLLGAETPAPSGMEAR